MLDLEKDYKDSNVMRVQATQKEGAHDDYPDSLMLAVYGSREIPEQEDHVEEITDQSPFAVRSGGVSIGSRLRGR